MDDEICNAEENDDRFEELLTESDDYITEIHEHLAKFEHAYETHNIKPAKQDHENTKNTDLTNKRKINLPRLTLDKFDGNVLNWQTFKDGFKAAVHGDSQLQDVQKFQYLKANLLEQPLSSHFCHFVVFVGQR